MAKDKHSIKTSITCKHIAPLEDLHYDVTSSSLKFAIFANNGSGKTFVSRLFRLLENDSSSLKDASGKILTDAYLSYGSSEGSFSFRIEDETSVKEDISIKLKSGEEPKIPSTNYIYHTFNQDYVEKNIRELDYIKDADDQNMQGFILGKAHIDVSDDKKRLEELKTEGKTKKDNIKNEIDTFLEEKISHIPNITRLNEYKDLTSETILKYNGETQYLLEKNVDEYIRDYDKIKSVPENLQAISEIETPTFDEDRITSIQSMLQKEYSLSEFAEDFKSRIKAKQEFIEKGLDISKNNICPFCERPYDEAASALIDLYTKFINDQEAKTIKQLEEQKKYLSNVISGLKEKEKEVTKQIKLFNEYKTRYIVSLEKEELDEISIKSSVQYLEDIIQLISGKIKNISISHTIQTEIIESLKTSLQTISDKIIKNNNKIKSINGKIVKISDENKEVRRNICKSSFVYLCNTLKNDIEEVNRIANDCKKLMGEIAEKEESMRTLKKNVVAKTIKQVLNFFFDGEKYTLDEDTFQLIFKKHVLDKGNVKYVLSEGEKNIIAFAYYLGDAHVKIAKDEDYKKLFLIIDDPISSLDFNYVYTVSGLIRKIKTIFPNIEHPRYIVLTHNNEFMRILCSNNIVDKRLLLQNGNLIEFNTNYTVPYISHLLDIYRVAREGYDYSHTTANSIRHIMETLVKFQNIELSDDGIDRYIQEYFQNDIKTYTLINDLSHGGWRSNDEPMLPSDYKNVCESIVCHIKELYPNQISYCEKKA